MMRYIDCVGVHLKNDTAFFSSSQVTPLYDEKILMNDTNVQQSSVGESDQTRQFKFLSLLLIEIPSMISCLFQLYQLLRYRAARGALHNHVIIALLFCSLLTGLFDVPLVLSYLNTNRSPARTPTACQIWNFVDLSLYALISVLMLWASIERHILIFFDRLVGTKRGAFLFHYLPLIAIPSYIILFYLTVVFLHPCVNNFDSNRVVCGELCYYSNTPLLGLMDQLFHNVLPSILIPLVNAALFIRVLWQKYYRARQAVRWQRHRRMILQLFPVSVLYVCGVMPFGVIFCMQLFEVLSELGNALKLQFFYLFYYMSLLLPLVLFFSVPHMRSKSFCKRDARVGTTVK